MLSRIKALFGKEEAPQPECFTGVGVVLISDQCAARLLGSPLSPADLVVVMNEVLSLQTETVQRFGGLIDKYVSFAAADFVVAAFGPAGRQRVQAIGRAYDRANSMQARIPTGGIITDTETLQALPESEKVGFVLRDGYAFRRE